MAEELPPGVLSKGAPVAVEEPDNAAFRATRGGTANDLRDLARMGKNQQRECDEMERELEMVDVC